MGNENNIHNHRVFNALEVEKSLLTIKLLDFNNKSIKMFFDVCRPEF